MSKKIITNEKNISIPLALWAVYDEYDYNDDPNAISTTTLMQPLRMILLGRKYKDCGKVIEVSNLIGSRLGSAIHDSFEKVLTNEKYVKDTLKLMGYNEDMVNKIRINPEKDFTNYDMFIEQRTSKKIGKWSLSGKFDMVFNFQVMDIKSTSVWTYMFGSNDDKYKLQMSIYRWLNQDKIKQDTGIIHFIFTDWSKTKAYQDRQYPQDRVLSKEFKLLSLKETEIYIKDKLNQIEKYESKDTIPLCSDEDLWKESDIWKYYKKKNANRATKVYHTEEEAYQRLADEGKGEVRYFPGGVKRCNYCNYTNVCSQYRDMKEEGLIK